MYMVYNADVRFSPNFQRKLTNLSFNCSSCATSRGHLSDSCL